MKIAGIVLAAGLSERMDGGPKQLLRFGDRTMAGYVAATVEKTSLDPVILVTGYMADEVEAALILERARVIRNPDYEQGNMNSLHAGIAALDEPTAVMSLPGDQPEVTVEIIETVAAAWSEFKPLAAAARYEGVIGHPWVLSAEALEATSGMRGSKALWRWLTEDHRSDLLEVELSRTKPIDVNTIEDYREALRRLGFD